MWIYHNKGAVKICSLFGSFCFQNYSGSSERPQSQHAKNLSRSVWRTDYFKCPLANSKTADGSLTRMQSLKPHTCQAVACGRDHYGAGGVCKRPLEKIKVALTLAVWRCLEPTSSTPSGALASPSRPRAGLMGLMKWKWLVTTSLCYIKRKTCWQVKLPA